MKTLTALIVMSLLSLPSFADVPVKNQEFATLAKAAAKSIYTVNWGSAPEVQFEVVKEKYLQDDVHLSGSYKVRVFEFEGGRKRDGGVDFDISVVDSAVLSVKVDCRICS